MYLHIQYTYTQTHALVIIKNFYEKFLTLSTNEREMKNEEKKISRVKNYFERYFFPLRRGIFRIQRGCNCTSTMVVPKETKRTRKKKKGRNEVIEREEGEGGKEKKRMITMISIE